MRRKPYRVGILTASDRCHAGTYGDLSGARIKACLNVPEYKVDSYQVVPDDAKLIRRTLKKFADRMKLDLVLTTGGTGLGPRDVTPEATDAVCEKMVPGLAEFLRSKSRKFTPTAVLSRTTSGIRGRTLIVNLPGHPKAVEECMALLLPILPHALAMIEGEGHEA